MTVKCNASTWGYAASWHVTRDTDVIVVMFCLCATITEPGHPPHLLTARSLSPLPSASYSLAAANIPSRWRSCYHRLTVKLLFVGAESIFIDCLFYGPFGWCLFFWFSSSAALFSSVFSSCSTSGLLHALFTWLDYQTVGHQYPCVRKVGHLTVILHSFRII